MPTTARAVDRATPERTTMPPLASAVPLAGDLRAYFTPRLGTLGNVTVATADPAVAAAGAKAVTLGQRIAFAPGRYRPDTESGRTLIAHELIHTRQQRGGAPDRGRFAEREAAALAPQLVAGGKVAPQVTTSFAPAADAEDYQVSMPEEDMQAQMAALGPSKLQSDIDAINEFLDRQTQSSPETAEMEARRDQLQRRLNALVKAAHTDPPKPKRGKAKPKGKAKNASEPTYAPPTSPDAPRILREQSSMPTTDPDAVKQEVDRIILWLQRSDVSPGDKSILRGELQTLAPQFEQARQQDSAKRQGARLQATFSSGGDGGAADLRANIAKIVGISTDPAEPGAAFIYDKNERIRISVAQAAELRTGAAAKMQDTLKRAENTVSMAWGLYRAQSEVDEEYPVVSAISAWLGGVDDPSGAMFNANQQMLIASMAAKGALASGDLLSAVDPLVTAATQARRMQMAVYAWQNGLISGAESAVAGLTFVRDCSAAIVIAIGAVVAAPFVAGAVAGAGITGLGASALTIGGTGVVVGTGAGATFGGAEVAGQLYAGADLDQALGEGKKVFKQRFGEGLAAGVGGGTTRVVGQALGPATTTLGRYGTQMFTQASGNFAGTTTGALYQGDDVGTALTKGGRSAAIGTISTTAGAPFMKTPGLQTAVSAGTGAFVNFHDAKAQGATDAEAWRGVGIGLATTVATSSSRTIQKDQKRYEQKGQKFGRDMKAGTLELKQQAAEFIRPLTQPLSMPSMAMAGPGGLTMPAPVMMMASTPSKGAKPLTGSGGGGGKALPKPPAATKPAKTFVKADEPIIDRSSRDVLRKLYPRRYGNEGFYRRIAGTGGIEKIAAVNNPGGGTEVSISGVIKPGALTRDPSRVGPGTAKAPNFNSQARSRIGGLWAAGLRGWQRLHLWGPGFGDEAVAGMMLGPKSINEIWQNGDALHSNGRTFRAGVEGFVREMAADAARNGSQVRLKATAESWPPGSLTGVKGLTGEPVFKRASYTFTYDGPDGKPISTTVHVEAPHPSKWGDGTAVKPMISVSGFGTDKTGD